MNNRDYFSRRNGKVALYAIGAIASFPVVYWVFKYATTLWGLCPVTAPIVVIESVNGEAFNVIRETQPVDECIRDWIGAYASWAGAIATVFVALPTLRWLRIQAMLPALHERLQRMQKIYSKLDLLKTKMETTFKETDAAIDKFNRYKILLNIEIINNSYLKFNDIGEWGIEYEILRNNFAYSKAFASIKRFTLVVENIDGTATIDHFGTASVPPSNVQYWQSAKQKYTKMEENIIQHINADKQKIRSELFKLNTIINSR